MWSRIYTDDDDIEEEDTGNTVNEHLNIHLDRTYPFQNSDPTRLNADNFLTQPITDEEIIKTVKSMKKTCPGKTGVNRTILTHLPIEAFQRLKKHTQCILICWLFPRQI